MRDFKEVTKLAIHNIDNSHQLDCIKNILQFYGWRYVASPINEWPTNLYLKNCEARHWLNKHLMLHTAIVDVADNMPAWRFLSEYQVPLVYGDYLGSYERDDNDKVWYGKILNTNDLIMYESSCLTGLIQEFHDVVDEYTQTLDELKEKEKNMKELNWKVEMEPCEDGYCIIRKDGKAYIDINGDELLSANATVASDIYFPSREDAEEVLEDLIENNPELAFARVIEKILPDDIVADLGFDFAEFVVERCIEALTDEQMVFTRHDVCKAIRQAHGTGVEIKYEDWKPVIMDILDTSLELYEYVKEWDGLKFVYKPDLRDSDADVDEDEETETVDSADTQTTTIDAGTKVDSSPKDTSEPERVSRRHILTAEQVRSGGGEPGARMHLIVYKGGFIWNVDKNKALMEHKAMGSPKILLSTTLKVDKSCNLRISKYIFDLANIGEWFGKDLTIA